MYKIIGVSKYGKEILDEAKDEKETEYLVKEYQLAFGKEWNVYYK